jgi:hypothetical protein
VNEDSFIKEIGRSYIVSSLLPSAFFVSILFLLFREFIPANFIADLKNGNIQILGQWVLVSVFTIWIAFFLFSSVDWIVKLFEGYHFPLRLKRFLVNRYAKQLKKQAISYYEIQKIKQKPVKKRTERDGWKFNQNWASALGEMQELEIETPFDDVDFMPTRLGNVLKASEIYAYDRYLIEAITVWPRLFSLLPSGFVKDMEEKNNHFMFLLNSTLLIYVAGGFCLLTSVIGVYYQACGNMLLCSKLVGFESLNMGFGTISPLTYFVIFLALICFGYRLYRIAVNAAQDFALFYRAGFDLYRTDLLKQLHYELPKDLGDERNAWLAISTFLVAGEGLEWDAEKLKYSKYRYHKMNGQPKESDQSR